MKITTKLTLDMLSGAILAHEFYEYDGPVEYAKKGSDAAKGAAAGAGQVGQTAQNLSASNQTNQNAARSQAAPFVSNLMATKPGGLSPYSQATYQSAVGNDAKEAQDQRAQGSRAAALRGFGGTPGTSASVINTANQRQGANDTMSYRGAMNDTLNQGLAGVNYLQGQQSIYNPNAPLQTATGAYGAQANAANVINQSPTLLGDIGQGLAGLAGSAGSVMTGMGNLGVTV